MKFIFLSLLFFSLRSFANLDTGSGALGNCTEANFAVNTRIYECTTLTITANDSTFASVVTSDAPIVIKVQGEVIINASVTWSLNGESPLHPTLSGGKSGAGGFAGGNTASDAEGAEGHGPGAGSKGLYATGTGVSSVRIGGGGGGASYSSLGEDGENGENDVDGIVAGTLGAKGSQYGNENNFSNSFQGGSGGGAGSGGAVGGAQIGGAGGGGGGALHLIAGGNVTINGTISLDGGDGALSSTPSESSGGGGGSGGALWIQSLGDISGTGNITANGGSGGKSISSTDNGEGGNGGAGRIRFDDQDGLVTLGSVTPNAVIKDIHSVISSGSNSQTTRQYTSSVSTCASIIDQQDSPLLNFNFVFDILIGFALFLWITKRHKKITQNDNEFLNQ